MHREHLTSTAKSYEREAIPLCQKESFYLLLCCAFSNFVYFPLLRRSIKMETAVWKFDLSLLRGVLPETVYAAVQRDAPDPFLSWLFEIVGWKGERFINISNNKEVCLLRVACAIGPRTLVALLEEGLDIECLRSKDHPHVESSELHLAAFYGKKRILQILLEYGANPNFLANGHTPLMCALSLSSSCILACMRILLDHGADPNLPATRTEGFQWNHPKNAKYPLILASQLDYTAPVRLLLWAGADTSVTNQSQKSALHFASSPEMVSLLLHAGLNVNHQDDCGNTILHTMITSDAKSKDSRYERTRLVLEAGAKVNQANNKGVTALHGACGFWDTDLFRLLHCHYNADVFCTDRAGRGMLHYANGNPRAIAALLAAGVDSRATCRLGRTLLHEFAGGRQDDVQQMCPEWLALLNLGLDVNARDVHGWTALHYASFLGHVGSVNTLLTAGANVHIRDDRGRTALHLSGLDLFTTSAIDVFSGHENFVQFFKKELQISAFDYYISSPRETVQALLKAGADCLALDDDGQYPWTFAAQMPGASLDAIFEKIQAASLQGLFG